MKLVEPDYHVLLVEAHRRWINERTAATSDAFDRVLMAAIAADKKRRALTPIRRQAVPGNDRL